MRSLAVLASLLLSCGIALAVTPGAYSVVELDLSLPRAEPKTNVYYISAEQFDERGFLVPLKTLAKHSSCKLAGTPADTKGELSWEATCAGETTYRAKERNFGSGFELDAKVTMLSKFDMPGSFKGTSLNRACREGDKPF